MFLRRFSKFNQKYPVENNSPLGVSPATARQRENAARLSASFFLKNCPGPREDVLSALATAVSLPVRFRQWFGDPDFLLLGAACWFLDYTEEHYLKRELAYILRKIPEGEIDDIPIMQDSAWPRDVLIQMFLLLDGRKGGYAGEFRKLLKLIDKEDAAFLRLSFRDAVLDYFLRFYEIDRRVKPAGETAAVAPATLSPLPAASDLFQKERGQGRIEPSVPDMKAFAEETPGIHLLLRSPELLGASEKKIQSVMYFRRITEKLTGFTVGNPYDICAAALLLEQEGDLLWYLNTLTDTVALCAQRQLPWTMQEADYQKPLSSPAAPDETPRFLFQPPEEGERAPLGSDIEEGELLNEAQLFYLATGYLLPRNCGPSRDVEDWFARQGLSRGRARELALCAMMVSREEAWEDWLDCAGRPSLGQWGGWKLPEDEEDDDDAQPDFEEPDEQEQERVEASGQDAAQAAAESDSRAVELARQLKEARGALHDAEQTVRQLRDQLAEERQSAMQNKLELNSLRDALFRLKSAEQSEEQEKKASIAFPWTGRRRILVFGGHDTWSKAIRPLLPGVRFCDRELLPDLNAIKSADIVWIQPNALSHKFYYRIIETARKENIAVRYFGFASARKCAEQLVEVELAAE